MNSMIKGQHALLLRVSSISYWLSQRLSFVDNGLRETHYRNLKYIHTYIYILKDPSGEPGWGTDWVVTSKKCDRGSATQRGVE